MLSLLIEDLDRLKFQLQVEAALRADEQTEVSKLLNQLALEAEVAVDRAKSLIGGDADRPPTVATS